MAFWLTLHSPSRTSSSLFLGQDFVSLVLSLNATPPLAQSNSGGRGEEQRDAIFGTGSEGAKDVQATVYIPGPLAEKMAARIDAEQCNRNELILQALREYLK